MWRVGLPWLLLSLGGVFGCGGRYEHNAPTSDAVGVAGSSTSSSGGSGGGDLAAGHGGAMVVAGSAGTAGDACAELFVQYGDYRASVVAEFSSFGCKIDSDCLAFYDQASCDTSCVLVITGARRGVIDRLNNFETTYCDPACSPEPWLSCPTATPARCVSGRCQ